MKTEKEFDTSTHFTLKPVDSRQLAGLLQGIFPGKSLQDLDIQQIGGLSNKNFKITLGGKSYVLRIPGNGSEGMVDRTSEEENSFQASRLGINPAVRYFNRDNGIKLTDYIEQAETLDGEAIRHRENLLEVIRILQTLHTSGIRFRNDFNVFREIQNYETLLAKSGTSMYEGYESIRERIFHLEDRLQQLGVERTACHNDMVAENFVKTGTGRIWLIDWEYSGMNDPHWEFAALFLENNFTREEEQFFLHEYFGGAVPRRSPEKIGIYKILMDILWAMWTCIKEKAGDDFGTYGMDRYRRALAHLEQYETDCHES